MGQDDNWMSSDDWTSEKRFKTTNKKQKTLQNSYCYCWLFERFFMTFSLDSLLPVTLFRTKFLCLFKVMKFKLWLKIINNPGGKIQWKEHINLRKSTEKKNTASEKECQHATGLKFLQEEELREEKDFLTNFFARLVHLRALLSFFEVQRLSF